MGQPELVQAPRWVFLRREKKGEYTSCVLADHRITLSHWHDLLPK